MSRVLVEVRNLLVLDNGRGYLELVVVGGGITLNETEAMAVAENIMGWAVTEHEKRECAKRPGQPGPSDQAGGDPEGPEMPGLPFPENDGDR